MTKKYSILLLNIALLLSLFSCQKFLDVIPSKGRLIPNAVTEYRGLLLALGMYTGNGSSLYFLGDDVQLDSASYTSYSQEAIATYTFEKGIITNPNNWIAGYKRIYVTNTIIDNVGSALNGTEEEKQTLLAQAHIYRGLEYFDMVNIYATTYVNGKENTQPGVPLILKADVNQSAGGRATVEQVYKQILDDIVPYIDKVPESASSFEITRKAAWGMLARVYLQMQRYEEAGAAARKALEYGTPFLDFNTVKFNKPGDYYAGVNFPDAAEWPYCIYYRRYNSTYEIPAMTLMSPSLDALFAPGDLRRTIQFTDTTNKGQHYTGNAWRFGGFTAKGAGGRNLGITIPELQLIVAEAAARKPALATALEQLNALRKQRIAAAVYQPLNSADPLQVLTWVLEERRRELFMLPIRIYDLKRLNLDTRFRKTIVHKWGNLTFTLPPDDPRYLPLLAPEILANSQITQNPR